jgi:uncharacterized protein RhaS with RHS repeats
VTSDPIGVKGGVNTYGYALQNPVRYFDPSGLVAWKGRIEMANAGYYLTKLGARFFLVSECVNGVQYEVKVNASSKMGPDDPSNIDIGVSPYNANASKVEFEDGKNSIDPNVFNGFFYLGSIGFNSPIGGVAYSKVVLGPAISKGLSFVVGTGDIGAVSVYGNSNLTRADKKECGCSNQF